VSAWLAGLRFHEISSRAAQELDDLLGVHTSVVSFVLQTHIEQGIALLAKLLESQEKIISPAVLAFPEHLRFGVPTTTARVLAVNGVRHRSAAVELGRALIGVGMTGEDRLAVFSFARESVLTHKDAWIERLGLLVVENTLADLSSIIDVGVQ
jgi:hypothetical protein